MTSGTASRTTRIPRPDGPDATPPAPQSSRYIGLAPLPPSARWRRGNLRCVWSMMSAGWIGVGSAAHLGGAATRGGVARVAVRGSRARRSEGPSPHHRRGKARRRMRIRALRLVTRWRRFRAATRPVLACIPSFQWRCSFQGRRGWVAVALPGPGLVVIATSIPRTHFALFQEKRSRKQQPRRAAVLVQADLPRTYVIHAFPPRSPRAEGLV